MNVKIVNGIKLSKGNLESNMLKENLESIVNKRCPAEILAARRTPREIARVR